MLWPAFWTVVTDLLLLALGAGLYTLAAPPYEWSSLGWFALAPFYLAIGNKTAKAAFGAGLTYGVLLGSGLTAWAYAAIPTYFPLPFPFGLLATVLSLSLSIGVYTGLVAVGSNALLRSTSCHRSWWCSLGIPGLWVGGELLRSCVLFGFCWELLGYTQYRWLGLIQIADLTGVYGVSFLLALSGYVVAEGLRCLPFPRSLFSVQRSAFSIQRSAHSAFSVQHSAFSVQRLPWPALGMLSGGVLLALLYGTVRLDQYAAPARPAETARVVRVAVVQGDVPSEQRWQPSSYANTLLKYASVTRRGIQPIGPDQLDLVVWPEFAVGFYLDKNHMLRSQLGWFARQLNAPLLLGAPRRETAETGARYYNSAYLLAPGGEILDVYDKMYLVTFAEQRPPGFPALVKHSQERPSEFTPGQRSTVFPLPAGQFGVLICFEATYPVLSRRLVHNGAQFLVNISNDSWLVSAGTAAAVQHFSMVVFRAIETRRAVARAATAGISGFIDPTGRPYLVSAQGEGVQVGGLEPRHDLTLYVAYGDWFACGCLGCGFFALGRMALGRIRSWSEAA